MIIDFSPLHFAFAKKPLLVGGKAMEYYGLRRAGDDIDLIVVKEDLAELIKLYPAYLKDLWGDFGVAVHGFEIWKTISYFDYYFLSEDAVEEENYLVISLMKLLMQKTLAMHNPKYRKDLELIVKKIIENQSEKSAQIKEENEQLIKGISKVSYIEKLGSK